MEPCFSWADREEAAQHRHIITPVKDKAFISGLD
jgi:hypothetical protein